jgi:hypothetical protein
MSALFVLVLCSLSITAGTIIGWVVGERRGRDSQWCDDKFQAWADDRARRDARGRFSRRKCRLVCSRNQCGNTEAP